MADMIAIAEAVKAGKRKDVVALVEEALAAGTEPGTILNDGFVAGMSVIGEMFKNNEVYVPEVLIAARAMKAGMEILKPKLIESNVASQGKVAMGTVKGDLHDIGKNLVCMMLEGAGFEVMDLGIDVSAEQFVAAINDGAVIVGLSTLLTTTMPEMQNIIQAIEAAGLRDKVKVMIGGAPITQNFSDEIGADGYSADAASAVDLAKKLIA